MVNAMPRLLFPQERPGTHCTGGLVGPQVRSGRARKISPPPVFDPRTVQPVAIRYTVHAIPAPSLNVWAMKISRANIETVIRTELNVCSIWFVTAMLRQFPPFMLMTT